MGKHGGLQGRMEPLLAVGSTGVGGRGGGSWQGEQACGPRTGSCHGGELALCPPEAERSTGGALIAGWGHQRGSGDPDGGVGRAPSCPH